MKLLQQIALCGALFLITITTHAQSPAYIELDVHDVLFETRGFNNEIISTHPHYPRSDNRIDAEMFNINSSRVAKVCIRINPANMSGDVSAAGEPGYIMEFYDAASDLLHTYFVSDENAAFPVCLRTSPDNMLIGGSYVMSAIRVVRSNFQGQTVYYEGGEIIEVRIIGEDQSIVGTGLTTDLANQLEYLGDTSGLPINYIEVENFRLHIKPGNVIFAHLDEEERAAINRIRLECDFEQGTLEDRLVLDAWRNRIGYSIRKIVEKAESLGGVTTGCDGYTVRFVNGVELRSARSNSIIPAI